MSGDERVSLNGAERSTWNTENPDFGPTFTSCLPGFRKKDYGTQLCREYSRMKEILYLQEVLVKKSRRLERGERDSSNEIITITSRLKPNHLRRKCFTKCALRNSRPISDVTRAPGPQKRHIAPPS